MTLRDRPDLASERILPEEEEAIRILWEKENAVGDISNEDAKRLLDKVRERKALIEQHVMKDMLVGRLKEGRRYPRRHMVAAVLALLVIGAVGAIIAGIVYLFQ